jgi:hypothetical protein
VRASYPSGNDNTGAFPNFNTINTGPPFDVSGNVFAQLNVDKTQSRPVARARADLEANLGDGFTIGIEGATGGNDSPVTRTDAGVANGGRRNFSRYSSGLTALSEYELAVVPTGICRSLLAGSTIRFLRHHDALGGRSGFDGFVLQGRYQILKGVTPFITLGLFPVFNTDLNFVTNNPSNSTAKTSGSARGPDRRELADQPRFQHETRQPLRF